MSMAYVDRLSWNCLRSFKHLLCYHLCILSLLLCLYFFLYVCLCQSGNTPFYLCNELDVHCTLIYVSSSSLNHFSFSFHLSILTPFIEYMIRKIEQTEIRCEFRHKRKENKNRLLTAHKLTPGEKFEFIDILQSI